MRSRAEIRGALEAVLRTVSLLILAWMLWLSLDRSHAETIVSARSANLARALHDWTSGGTAPDRISAQLDSTPSPLERDWLVALWGAGSPVSWSGDLPAGGVSVQPVRSPRGGLTVLIAAPSGADVRVSDDVGPLDTAKAARGGARFDVPAASGVIQARVGGSTARASVEDSVELRRVLVLGSAGWESKFVIAALEEDGWKVDAELPVAPGVSVRQGSAGPLDTARYSAIVVLDGSATSRAGDIARYVSSGGGLILAASAGGLDAFSPLRAGSTGRVVGGAVLASEPGATSLRSLPLIPIASLRVDAIALDRRDGSIAAAARRHGAGRVLQLGYVDTWRWRMSGGDASFAEHRAWWTRSVASVAYAPRVRTVSKQLDDAPVARLIGALGSPSSRPPASLATAAGLVSLWWLFSLLAFCLLAEWTSRRLRGAR
ncbi:MAG: hypothetical protein ABI681_02130 [Gemmatimonadales bacterium]